MAKHARQKRRAPNVISTTRIRAGSAPSLKNWKWPLLQAVVIVAAILWIYWPVLHGGWLWDDDELIVSNPLIHDPYGLWKIWSDPGSLIDYFPLKVSVEWIEWHLWGMDTLGYHLTSIFLHIFSALLVWRLLSKLGLRLAWLGGLIFAIHPAQVESVAWIAELKNTLSLPPFLLAMGAFIDYENRGKRNDYFLALGLFLAAMLCKTTMVMFPVVILLYVWWKRGRIGWNDLKESIPFFAVSLGMGLVTIWFLHQHSIDEHGVQLAGFLSRLALAGLSISFYFSKCIWPAELLTMYPRWPVDPPFLIQFLPWPVLGVVIGWLWMKREGWGRHALFGLGFFLITLAPFVGFTDASYMRFTWVMDHCLYIPLIGLIGLAIAGMSRVEMKFSGSIRYFAVGIVTATIALLAWESRGYAELYTDGKTLWSHTVKYNPGAWMAHYNLGIAMFKAGRIPEAIDEYEQTEKINPDYADAFSNLGGVLLTTHRTSEAIQQFDQALKLNPDDAATRSNLGAALLQSGRTQDAIDQFEQALKLNPDLRGVRENLDTARRKMAPAKN